MAVEYELALLDPRGKVITRKLTAFTSLEYTRKVNDVGSLVLTLPIRFPLWWFGRDYRIEIWRAVDMLPPYCEGDTQWLVRKINISREGGDRQLQITAFDLNHLLKRRITAYDAESPETTKADYADDMMKEVVLENLGLGSIDAARDISDWMSIQPNYGLAMPIEKAFARRELLGVFQELAQESYENGIYLAFDIVRLSTKLCQFRTYVNQRGTDRTKGSLSPLLFGSKYGNLVDDIYQDDGTEEATFIYAGGQGQEDDREIQTAQDDARIGVSPFGRIERFVDARHASLASTVQDEAEAELRARLPKKTITGKIATTNKCQYGVHFKFGDRVPVETDEASTDAFIDAVHVTVKGGVEEIDIGLVAEWD